MKILSQFDNFFLEAYQHSSMARFIGININIDRFRKDKIYLPRKLLVESDLVKGKKQQPKAQTAITTSPHDTQNEIQDIKAALNKLQETLSKEHRKSVAQQMMINSLFKSSGRTKDKMVKALKA